MAANVSVDLDGFVSLGNKLDFLSKNSHANLDSNEITRLLDEFIHRLHDEQKKFETVDPPNSAQVKTIVDLTLQFSKLVSFKESLKVTKVCQSWECVMQLSNASMSGPVVEQLLNWICCALQQSDESVIPDVLNCLAAAAYIKEVKQSKILEKLIGSSGLLFQKISTSNEITSLNVIALKIICNFSHCPGEKDWSSVSKDIIQCCIGKFTETLEYCLKVDCNNPKLLKALVLCFHGLENLFVRFSSGVTAHLPRIFGLANCYILFGIAGQSLKYSPLLPSSIPFAEKAPCKAEQGKTPIVRKKRVPPNKTPKSRGHQGEPHNDEEAQVQSKKRITTDNCKKPWNTSHTPTVAQSSSDSELSDTDGLSALRLKEAQAKVRSCALKMLSAAFKFCDQRTVMGYWSAFLPDSSSGPAFRHTLITPILKDSSIKVRCNALVALSSLLQAVQPTLAMASFQENRAGAFIPFSQTIAETVIAVHRSLLLSLSAEQSVGALIQLFKCLTVAASVFPYDKLPTELVSKTAQQCSPFLVFKDQDVKVACLSVLRVLLCTHSAHTEIVRVFWDSSTKKCWLLEHCLALIDRQVGFPQTLESLLVIGEVTRSNIELSQPYMEHIVHSICEKLLTNDPGIQIRCAKALALVCSGILQEMDKDESDQIITRDEAVQLWIHIIRKCVVQVLQEGSNTLLRAEVCAILATIGSSIFECLPRDLRILYATLALGCAADSDPSIRASAIRTIGFAVTFNTLSDDASFLLDCSEHILLLLNDDNLPVALNASWALGNIADTLDKDKNSLLEELPRDFLINLIRAAVHTAQGPMKVRGNVIRAVGIFLKIVSDIPAEGDGTAILFDQAISTVTKQVTTGNFMKNRWNACYACGNIMQNVALLTAFSHWMDKLLDCLLNVFRHCSNFKVRISAANALLHLDQRQLLSTHYTQVWTTLLDSLAESEQIDDFSEFQHHETMCRQICNTLCKLIILMTKDDLGQLYEALMKYYDVFSSHFGKFLKSLLPDQLELVIEASGYVRQLGLPHGSLTATQKSTLELLQDLLIIPK